MYLESKLKIIMASADKLGLYPVLNVYRDLNLDRNSSFFLRETAT